MDIFIDRPIGTQPGEVSVQEIKQQLARAAGQPITVRIHSEGGSVFEAFAMIDALKAYPGPKRCIVESAAFSAASLVAMAFDDRQATENAFVMVHNPHMDDESEPPVIEKLRRRMVDLYAAGTRKSKAFIERLMASETFFDAQEAMQNGFVNAIVPSTARAVAKLQTTMQRTPKLRAVVVAKLRTQTSAKSRWRAAVNASYATTGDRLRSMALVDKTHPGLRQQMIAEANRR